MICSWVTTAWVMVTSAVALKCWPLASPEAVMVTVPAETPVTLPLSAPLLLTVATAGSLERQLTTSSAVTSCT